MFLFFYLLACRKVTAIKKFLTGNPTNKPKPKLNDRDDEILRILGETPNFAGIFDNKFETSIQVKKTEEISDISVTQCTAETVGEVSEIVKAINSGNYKLFFLYTFKTDLEYSYKKKVQELEIRENIPCFVPNNKSDMAPGKSRLEHGTYCDFIYLMHFPALCLLPKILIKFFFQMKLLKLSSSTQGYAEIKWKRSRKSNKQWKFQVCKYM